MAKAKNATVVLGWGIMVSTEEFVEKFPESESTRRGWGWNERETVIDTDAIEQKWGIEIRQHCTGNRHPFFISGPVVKLNGVSEDPVLVDPEMLKGPSESIQKFTKECFPDESPQLMMHVTGF